MTARELENIRETLTARGKRLHETVAATCATAGATGFAATFSPRLAIAFGVATAVAAAMAFVARNARTECIARLALDADAYSIPEVAEYGRRCATMASRERLARRIRELIAERHPTQSLHLVDRVARYAFLLERTATEIAVAAPVRPPAVVACRRLLTHGAESPLYNPRLPAEELRFALERIRRGLVAR